MNFSKKLVVKPGSKRFSLKKRKTNETFGLKDKDAAKAKTKELLARLAELQYTLYAEGKQSLLIVLQALDAGGKDSTIRSVLGPINPQGVLVTSFKRPTDEELAHDFLWRIHKAVPAKGMIGVFNRSHYEDVLVVRVHDIVPKKVWSKRFDRINEFERQIADNGTKIVKFFLHVGKDEQYERLVDRLDQPHKHWKCNPGDFEERKKWNEYMKAFEDVFCHCSTDNAPWYIIPADRKWVRNLAISSILVETLEGMKCRMPEPEFDVAEIRKKYVE